MTSSTASDTRVRVALANEYGVVIRALEREFERFGDRIAVVDRSASGGWKPSWTPADVDVVVIDTFAARRRSVDRIAASNDAARGEASPIVVLTRDLPSGCAHDLGAAGADAVGAIVLKRVRTTSLVSAIEAVAAGRTVTAPIRS